MRLRSERPHLQALQVPGCGWPGTRCPLLKAAPRRRIVEPEARRLVFRHGATKRRPRLRRGGFATQADALAGWEAAKGKLRKGADPASRLTVGQFLRIGSLDGPT